MKCSYCQQVISDTAKECPYCGTPVPVEKPSIQTENQEKKAVPIEKNPQKPTTTIQPTNRVTSESNVSNSPIAEKSSGKKGCLLFILGIVFLMLLANLFSDEEEGAREQDSIQGEKIEEDSMQKKSPQEKNPDTDNGIYSNPSVYEKEIGLTILYHHNQDGGAYRGQLTGENGVYRYEDEEGSVFIQFALDGKKGCVFSAYFMGLEYENVSGLYEIDNDEEYGGLVICDLEDEISLYFYHLKPLEPIQLFEEGRYEVTVADESGLSATLNGTIVFMDGAHCFYTDNQDVVIAFILLEGNEAHFAIEVDGEEEIKQGWYTTDNYENSEILVIKAEDGELDIGVCKEGKNPWN